MPKRKTKGSTKALNLKKRPQDANRPKRNLSGYVLYLNDNRERFNDETVSQMMKRCGTQWRELTNKQRAPYQEKAETMKKKYMVKLEKYRKTVSWLEHQEILKEYKRKKIFASFKKDPNKPKKALTGYMLYLKNVRPTLVEEGMRHAEVVAKMAVMWKQLSANQQQKWNNKSEKCKKVYEKDMIAYKKTAKSKSYEKEKEEYLIKQKEKISLIREAAKKKKRKLEGKNKRANKKQKKKKTSKKKKKEKMTNKDPNAPKRSLSAYTMYLNDKRGPLSKKYPRDTIQEVGKRCKKQWEELSDEKKASYKLKAMSDKAQYLRKLLKYQKSDSLKKHQKKLKKFKKMKTE